MPAHQANPLTPHRNDADYFSSLLGGNPASREAMDLYNNEVGRRIAAENPDADPQRLAELVDKAITEGRTVVLDENGEIEWSDKVAKHETGIALKTDIPLPAPTT
ncbi:DUF6973 domain-containing protein [Gordonia hongkongensis]|uniref:DUF6973 domain-containing protein n=1 Tax=Gordonia hongkongensis TaxID=1701090 RepID=UPI003D0B1903